MKTGRRMNVFRSAGPVEPFADPSGFDKNRFLSFTMIPQSGTLAVRVRLVDLHNPAPPNQPCCPPGDFSGYEGEDLWAGPPAEYPESA